MEGQQKFSTDSDKEVLDNRQLMSIAVIGNEREGRQVAMVISDAVEEGANVWQATRSDSPHGLLVLLKKFTDPLYHPSSQ